MRALLLFSILVILASTAYAALVDKTVIEWSRQIRTCDADGDRDIPMVGTTPIVYAMNDQQTTFRHDNSPAQHSTRGSSEIYFGDPNAGAHRKIKDPSASVVSFRTKTVTIPATQTYYHCQGFRYNWGENKRHAIQITPHINFANREFVHHIVFQICTLPLTPVDLLFSGDCYTPPMPPGLLACDQKSMFAAWAVGGGPIVLPPQAGFPVQGTSYYMMQIHYSNPRMVSGVRDSVAMNVTVTPNLRPNDAACLQLLRSYATILVPPLMPEYAIEGYADYFDIAHSMGAFPPNAYFFGSLLHMHQLGRKMRVMHYRNGAYIGDIDGNPNYDFEFQQTVGLSPHYKFAAGDSIKWECVYNSTSRLLPTFGGTSTGNEMCQAYMYYYPATRDPLTLFDSYPATLVTGNSPAFVSAGLRQSGIPITGGPILSRSTPPLPKPRECSTTRSKNYTVGTAGTEYLPMSSFNPSKYRNSKVLDSLGKYVLHWNLRANKTSGNGIIQFAAEVETKGWLGFGISPNGGMIGADIVLGWVDEVAGKVSLLDRKATATAQPMIDPTQDIFDIRGYKGLLEQTPPEFNPIFYNTPVSNIPPRGSTKSASNGAPPANTVIVSSSSLPPLPKLSPLPQLAPIPPLEDAETSPVVQQPVVVSLPSASKAAPKIESSPPASMMDWISGIGTQEIVIMAGMIVGGLVFLVIVFIVSAAAPK